MAVILITHDLTIVRQFADYVYVMQLGEVRGAQPHRAACSPARSTPTRSICSPPSPRASPTRCRRERRVVLEGRDVRVTFTLQARRHVQARLLRPGRRRRSRPRRSSAHETLGLVGEFGLRQDHVRQGADPADHNHGGEIFFDGRAPSTTSPPRDAAAPLAHADRLPGPVRLAQPAHVGPPDHRGRADRQPHRRQRAASAIERVTAGAARCRPPDTITVALPARVLRRPAPAHRHRPRHRARARVHPARRADLGARPLGAGPDHRPPARAAATSAASATCSSATT